MPTLPLTALVDALSRLTAPGLKPLVAWLPGAAALYTVSGVFAHRYGQGSGSGSRVRGQGANGRVMAHVQWCRGAICGALDLCPVGAWTAVEESSRFMRATGLLPGSKRALREREPAGPDSPVHVWFGQGQGTTANDIDRSARAKPLARVRAVDVQRFQEARHHVV